MSLLALQLAWRFRTGKSQQGFTSFFSASSTIGIALGCFVLILLLSVMNGFERELKDRLLALIPHGELYAVEHQGMQNWQQALKQTQSYQGVKLVQAYSKATGMLQKGNKMKSVEVLGLSHQGLTADPILQELAPAIQQSMQSNEQGLLLGNMAMQALGLKVGDKVQLLLPRLSDDLSLKVPKSLWFTLVGALHIGGELDGRMAIVHLPRLSDALGVTTGAQGLRYYFDDPFLAQQQIRNIGFAMSQPLYLSSWFLSQGHLYKDIQLVRVVVYLALTLVIAVACFNIVSTLIVAVNEKRAEIAMLKTMGAKDSLILQVFLLQGLINGILGAIVGSILGCLAAIYASDIAAWLENLLGVAFLSGDIYFIDFLPSELRWAEVGWTLVIALSLSTLATFYPAKKAAQVAPAQGVNG